MQTKKIFHFIIPAILVSLFYNVVVPRAYAQAMVFGPVFFSHEIDAPQQTVRNFSVPDIHQKFLLSVHHGGDSTNKTGCTIKINGKPVVSQNACTRLSRTLTRQVFLQKNNDISVEVTGATGIPVVVTIVNLAEHTMAAEIPPIGKLVNFEGYASIVFPAGSFDKVREINISATSSAAIDDIFEANATGPRLPYEIRINTGDNVPEKDIGIDLNIPETFYSSSYQIHIFAMMQDHSEVPDAQGRFFLISSSVDEVTMTVRTTLPRNAFSNLYGKNKTHEAVILVGLIQ